MSAPSSPDTRPRDNGALVAWSVAAVAAATVLVGALLPGRPHAPASPAADPDCLEWSDGCSVCRRIAEGPACSLPGIACTPGALRCLHRADG